MRNFVAGCWYLILTVHLVVSLRKHVEFFSILHGDFK